MSTILFPSVMWAILSCIIAWNYAKSRAVGIEQYVIATSIVAGVFVVQAIPYADVPGIVRRELILGCVALVGAYAGLVAGTVKHRNRRLPVYDALVDRLANNIDVATAPISPGRFAWIVVPIALIVGGLAILVTVRPPLSSDIGLAIVAAVATGTSFVVRSVVIRVHQRRIQRHRETPVLDLNHQRR